MMIQSRVFYCVNEKCIERFNVYKFTFPFISIIVSVLSMIIGDFINLFRRIKLDVAYLERELGSEKNTKFDSSEILIAISERSGGAFLELSITHTALMLLSLFFLVCTLANSKIQLIIKIITTVVVLWFSIFWWLFSEIA
jgi:hypothetical protein